jgi:hypothetical protein
MIRSGYYDFSEPLCRRNLCRMKNVDGHFAVISTGLLSRDKLSTRVHWLLLWGSFTELNILKHFHACGCDWEYSHLWIVPFEWETCEAHLFLSVCVEKGYGKSCMQLENFFFLWGVWRSCRYDIKFISVFYLGNRYLEKLLPQFSPRRKLGPESTK